VHRPPAVLASKYPGSTKPLSRYLVAAPRCYAFLTHFPFFALHMKVSSASNPSGLHAGFATAQPIVQEAGCMSEAKYHARRCRIVARQQLRAAQLETQCPCGHSTRRLRRQSANLAN